MVVATKQLRGSAVTTAKLKDGAVTGAKVGDRSLTGSDIVASTLGNVPSATHASSADSAEATTAGTADKLGEFGPAGFIQGTGSVLHGYQSTSDSGGVTLMSSETLGEVRVDCFAGHSRIAYFPGVNGSLWWSHGGPPGFAELTPIMGQQLSDQATSDLITAQFTTPTKTVTTVISGHPGATCTYAGQAIIQE